MYRGQERERERKKEREKKKETSKRNKKVKQTIIETKYTKIHCYLPITFSSLQVTNNFPQDHYSIMTFYYHFLSILFVLSTYLLAKN